MSLSGEFDLQTPRDREGTFEPHIVGKRQIIITEGLEEKVIALNGMGNSLRDISSHIQEIYGMELSATQLSEITDKVIPPEEFFFSSHTTDPSPLLLRFTPHNCTKQNSSSTHERQLLFLLTSVRAGTALFE